MNPLHAFRRSARALVSEPQRSNYHYRVIDLMRGLAAIAVLLWHYQNFWQSSSNGPLENAVLLKQPLANILWPFYTMGYYAVQLFWTISGFVFSAVYGNNIRSTASFIIARFARLYPLHFITLIVVTLLEFISIGLTGTTQVFGNFDKYHFVLNLMMVPYFPGGYSFNGPVWSIIVELVIYVAFWLSHRYLFRFGVIGPALASVLFGAAMAAGIESKIISCGFYFFSGCTLYVLHRSFPDYLIGLLTVIIAVIGVLIIRSHESHAMKLFIFAAVLFSSTIEHFIAPRIVGLNWIGDATYSLYLWHVPVQIIVLLAFAGQPWLMSIPFLIAFVGGMMIVARISFVTLERPLRDAVSRRLGPTRAPIRISVVGD